MLESGSPRSFLRRVSPRSKLLGVTLEEPSAIPRAEVAPVAPDARNGYARTRPVR
jgi:hypothetical protein